jgi:hypothetical protein
VLQITEVPFKISTSLPLILTEVYRGFSQTVELVAFNKYKQKIYIYARVCVCVWGGGRGVYRFQFHQ